MLASTLLLSAMLFPGCSPKENRISHQEVESRVKNLLQMPTFEHIYRDIIYYGKNERFWFIPTVNKEILFSIEVRVQAGIDFSNGLRIEPGSEGELVIFLPPPEILVIDADESTIRQYYIREYGERVSRLEYYDVIDAQKESIRNDAVKRGILLRAEENAKQLLTNLLEYSGFQTITFRSAQSGVRKKEEEP